MVYRHKYIEQQPLSDILLSNHLFKSHISVIFFLFYPNAQEYTSHEDKTQIHQN